MNYYSRIEWNSETCEVVSRTSTTYQGPADLCKGGNSQAQQGIDNAVQQQQLAMQQQVFNETNPTIQQIIAGGGLLPEQEAALRAQMINSLPQTYNNLTGQLSQQLTARGLTGGQYGAGGGDVARTFGALGSMEAGQAQQGVFDIAQLKQQGLNSALGLGNQQMATTAQAGSSALGSATSAAQAADTAQTGFWGSLFGALGAAGGGIGGGLLARK